MPAEQGRRTKPAFLAMQGLRVTGLVGDMELGPGVLAAEHEVADEWGRGVVAEGAMTVVVRRAVSENSLR
jgi:hypothetical protein